MKLMMAEQKFLYNVSGIRGDVLIEADFDTRISIKMACNMWTNVSYAF